MSRPASRPRLPMPAGDARGFALVGVTMFVIVLTILALSLFSLSSFESQFVERSLGHSQAFYNAVGGQDRARWVLRGNGNLGDVKQNLPAGVIWTSAYQNKGGTVDSVGPVDWGGQDVFVRVTGLHRGERRTVEAQYMPSQESDHYKRLMTLSGWGNPDTGLFVRPDNAGDSTWAQTWLGGKVWQNAASPGPPCDQFNKVPGLFSWQTPASGVPAPDVATYFGAHWGSAQIVPGGSLTYNLSGLGWANNVGFFRTPSGGADISMVVGPKASAADPDLEINVTQTVVWMFDRGFASERRVHVSGGPTDLLVLVAESPLPSNINRFYGLSMLGAIDSPLVPVIMVASQNIKLLHDVPAALDQSSLVSYLSIYARSVELMGPTTQLPIPPRLMTLLHPTDAAPDLVGGVVDRLSDLGLLPNIDAGENHTLPLRPGTWHQVAQN